MKRDETRLRNLARAPKCGARTRAGLACTHTAAMAVLARFGGGGGTERRVAALGSAAARLLKAYATQVEVLRRLRHGGHQYVRVEHVHVNDGGQAIIGNVKTAGSGGSGSPEHSASGVTPAHQDC
jgi:hypothetical protein